MWLLPQVVPGMRKPLAWSEPGKGLLLPVEKTFQRNQVRNFCTRFLIHGDLERLKLGLDCVLDGLGDLVGVYTLALGQSLNRSGEGSYLRS